MNLQDVLTVSVPVITGLTGYGSAALVYRQKELRAQRLEAACQRRVNLDPLLLIEL